MANRNGCKTAKVRHGSGPAVRGFRKWPGWIFAGAGRRLFGLPAVGLNWFVEHCAGRHPSWTPFFRFAVARISHT
jgi:hypothetical protein